jgi:SAM-dependent methyltransferase
MPAPDEALRLYDAAYYRTPSLGYADYAADEPLFREEFRRRLRAIRRAGGRGRLLDVGAATGALLQEAATLGFEAEGVEPSEEMAALARRRSGRPVASGSVLDLPLAPGSFGVVTCFDVLEHLPDPVGAMRRLRDALVPGGLLAVTVPDFGGWWARASGRRWPLITPWEHLVYFTRRTLTRALREAGLLRVRFHAARTVFSVGTATAKASGPRRLPAAVARRGVRLPFGSLFALAAAPRGPSRRVARS